jgi:hypothetical protein
MKNWIALAGALALALLLAIWAVHPPAPRPAHAPADSFSAERAMNDVRVIARAPHVTGSAENALVRRYLSQRLAQLGMVVEAHPFALSPKSVERLRGWDPRSEVTQGENVIGLLPGRDPRKPALLLMAHHDTVWDSPGAADDSAGVSAALEIVRALKSQERARDVIVLLTDAEELGLDGARVFFSQHPLAKRVGVIINLETRGGGGRAAMFETGPGNGGMIDVFSGAVARPSGNSLGVLVYKNMPNDTDYSEARDRGIPGFNFAFTGLPALYHSPMSRPDRIDPGSIQDMGAQALGLARALAAAETLPAKAADAAFGDVLGLFTIAYPAWLGWLLLGIAAALAGFAAQRAIRSGEVTRGALGSGLALALALPLHGALLLRLLNHISGTGRGSNYYDRLASIPMLEAQALLACLAVLIAAAVLPRPAGRLQAALPALVMTALVLVIGGWSTTFFIIGLLAAAVATAVPRERPALWSGWLGLIGFVLLIAFAAQIFAPTASPAVVWPLLVAAALAAATAALDPRLDKPATPWLIALPAALAAAHLLYLGHLTFLGIGAPLAEVMTVYLLLVALLVWPLTAALANRRVAALLAALLLVAAAATALWVRFDPIADTIPPYSDKS